jgi:hypothetical protein
MARMLLIFALICFAGWPLAAAAHVNETSGSITALLHVKPDDKPVAGQAAELWFNFDDSKNKFAAPACDCRIVIKQGNRTLVDRPIAAREKQSQQVIRVDYVFPYQAAYDVALMGSSRQTDGFKNLELDYTVVVDRGTIKAASSPYVAWGILGFVGLAALVSAYFIFRELRDKR